MSATYGQLLPVLAYLAPNGPTEFGHFKDYSLNLKTRMVQLPATAAIEYVATCWVSRAGGIFVRGSFARGTFVWGAYARSPQVQCVYVPSRLSVLSIVA